MVVSNKLARGSISLGHGKVAIVLEMPKGKDPNFTCQA